MKIAFLYPGQGSQTIGMGKDLYEAFESSKAVYDLADKVTGEEISKISFEGPVEKLNQTKYTQLATLTESLALTEIFNEKGIEAEATAGLSLGEYSSLVYAGVLSKEDAFKLVLKRGTCMQELVPHGDWKMAAVLGLADEQVDEACKKVTNGFVVPANYNCNGQVVISGDSTGVAEATELCKEAGARKVLPLNTAGPFHTSKLQAASDEYRKALEQVKFGKFETIVYKNLDAMPYTDGDNLVDILAKHIISPVRFSKTIQEMLDCGIDTFIEIGPGKALSGFVKKTVNGQEVNIYYVNDVATLNDVVEKIENNN